MLSRWSLARRFFVGSVALFEAIPTEGLAFLSPDIARSRDEHENDNVFDAGSTITPRVVSGKLFTTAKTLSGLSQGLAPGSSIPATFTTSFGASVAPNPDVSTRENTSASSRTALMRNAEDLGGDYTPVAVVERHYQLVSISHAGRTISHAEVMSSSPLRRGFFGIRHNPDYTRDAFKTDADLQIKTEDAENHKDRNDDTIVVSRRRLQENGPEEPDASGGDSDTTALVLILGIAVFPALALSVFLFVRFRARETQQDSKKSVKNNNSESVVPAVHGSAEKDSKQDGTTEKKDNQLSTISVQRAKSASGILSLEDLEKHHLEEYYQQQVEMNVTSGPASGSELDLGGFSEESEDLDLMDQLEALQLREAADGKAIPHRGPHEKLRTMSVMMEGGQTFDVSLNSGSSAHSDSLKSGLFNPRSFKGGEQPVEFTYETDQPMLMQSFHGAFDSTVEKSVTIQDKRRNNLSGRSPTSTDPKIAQDRLLANARLAQMADEQSKPEEFLGSNITPESSVANKNRRSPREAPSISPVVSVAGSTPKSGGAVGTSPEDERLRAAERSLVRKKVKRGSQRLKEDPRASSVGSSTAGGGMVL